MRGARLTRASLELFCSKAVGRGGAESVEGGLELGEGARKVGDGSWVGV